MDKDFPKDAQESDSSHHGHIDRLVTSIHFWTNLLTKKQQIVPELAGKLTEINNTVPPSANSLQDYRNQLPKTCPEGLFKALKRLEYHVTPEEISRAINTEKRTNANEIAKYISTHNYFKRQIQAVILYGSVEAGNAVKDSDTDLILVIDDLNLEQEDANEFKDFLVLVAKELLTQKTKLSEPIIPERYSIYSPNLPMDTTQAIHLQVLEKSQLINAGTGFDDSAIDGTWLWTQSGFSPPT